MLHLIFSNAALACSQFLFGPEDTVVLMRGVAPLGIEALPCKVLSLTESAAASQDEAKLLVDLIEQASSVRSYF